MATTSRSRNNNARVILSILLNLVIPSVILSRLSGPTMLGPTVGLIVALVFPLGYGISDLWTRKRVHLFTILGFLSILLTGIFTLVQLNHFWFTVKETAFPALFAVISFVTRKRPQNVFFQILSDAPLFDSPNFPKAFKNYAHPLYASSSIILTVSFSISAVLNFILARVLLTAPVGTEAFNTQLAYMNTLSYFIILIPSMALMIYALIRFFHLLEKETGVPLQTILDPQASQE